MSSRYPPYPPYCPGKPFRGPGLEAIERTKTIESEPDSGIDVSSLNSSGANIDGQSATSPDDLPTIPRHQVCVGESSRAGAGAGAGASARANAVANAILDSMEAKAKAKAKAQPVATPGVRTRVLVPWNPDQGKGKGKVVAKPSGPQIQTCGPSHQTTHHLQRVPSKGRSLRIHIFHEGDFLIPHITCHTTHIVTGGTRVSDLFRFHHSQGGPEPSRRLSLHQLGWYVRVGEDDSRWVQAECESIPIRWNGLDMTSVWESDWMMVGKEAWLTCRCDDYGKYSNIGAGTYGG